MNAPPALSFGANRAGNAQAGSELLYKIFNGDTKLIRSILEANNF